MALGGTIKEIQSKITLPELRTWLQYRKKNGPMSDIRKYDLPAAKICSTLSSCYGGKLKPADFMPWGKEDRQPTLNELISALGPGVKIGKRR